MKNNYQRKLRKERTGAESGCGPVGGPRSTFTRAKNILEKALAMMAIIMATGQVGVQANTCPQLLGGQMLGPAIWQADASPDEKTYYRYITSDDFMKLDSIFYCLDSETQTHFQGFVATFENTKDSSKQAFPFGVTTQTSADVCRGFYVTQEIQWIKIKQDEDDIEGLIIGNQDLGIQYPLMTTDILDPAAGDSPVMTFPGRLIGFGVTTAFNTRGQNEQIVRVGPVFNACNCVGSTFNEDNPPEPMRLIAGTNEGTMQTLAYRTNVIEQWYGQNCGDQTVLLVAQVSPSPLAISLGTSGAISPKGTTFTDSVSIGAATQSLVGRWNFALQYLQVQGQGSLNYQNQEVFMPTLTLPFFVQVDPCPVNSFTAETPTEQIRHTISTITNSRSSQINFIQQTDCGYEQTYSFIDMPDFVIWDENQNQLVIQAADEVDVGTYTITVVATIEVPDDFQMSSFTEKTATSVISLEVSRVPIECESTQFEAFTLPELEGSVYQAELQEILLQPASDSASSSNGNGDGFSYCGDRSFKFVNPATVSSFLSLDENGRIIYESIQVSDIGRYEVEVSMYLVKFPDVSKTQTMIVTVNPCQVLSYTAVLLLDTINYEIRSGPLSTDQFLFELEPKECNYYDDNYYEQSVQVSVPFLVKPNGNDRLTIESDDEDTENGQLQVTVTSTIDFPTDYTTQTTESFEASFVFTLVLENPYYVDCNQVTIDPFELQDMQTRVFGETFEQTLPFVILDSSIGRCGVVLLSSLDPGYYENYLQITAEKIILQTNSVSDEGRYEIEMQAYLEDYPQQKRLISFFVTIDSCEITDFMIQMEDFSYTIGSGSQNSQDYTFETFPALCNTYERQQVFTGLPDFMEASNGQISALTNKVLDAGTYVIELSVTFRVPIDYTRSEFENFQASTTSFIVTVIDSCEETILDSFQFEDVLLSVLGREVSRDLPLKVQDSVSRESGNQDGLTQCGERRFELIGAEGQTYYTVDQLTEQIVFQSSNNEDIGRLTLSILVTLKNYPSVTSSSTNFVLTIDPCRISSFTGISMPQSGTQQIGQDLQTSFQYTFSQMNSCSYIESIEVIDIPDFMTHNMDDKNFSFQSDQLTDAGEYTVTVISTIQVPQDYTNNSYTPFVSEISFSLIVTAGCEYSSFQNWALDGTSLSATVKGVIASGQLESAEDSVSSIMGNKDGFSFCGSRAYRVVNQSEISGFLTIDQNTDSITLESTSEIDIGQYSVQIEISLQEYPLITELALVSVTIDPCQVTSFEGAITEAPISYSVDTPATTGGLYSFSQTPSCGYDQTISIDGLTEFMTHDTMARIFSVETYDPLDEATYDIIVESTIEVPTDWTQSSFTQVKSSVNFQIIVQEECGETVLDDFILFDMIIQDEGGEEIQSFSEVQDSVSKELGIKDGISFCGARKYEFLQPELHSSYLSILGTKLTGFTVDNSAIGVHQVSVKVTLFDNPEIFKVAEFTVTINPCRVTDFQIIFGPLDQDYMIQAELQSLGFFTVEQSPCSHPVTFEIVVPQPFITFDQDLGEIMVQTDDLSDHKDYQIETRAKIFVPMDHTRTNFEEFESIFSFQLNIVDPCTLTQLDELLLEDMMVTVLGEASIKNFEEVQDSESRLNVNSDNSGITFCGPRIYTILEQQFFASIDETTKEITIVTDDDQNIGLQQLELLVQLQDYPNVTTTASLQVTINPCKITDYTISVEPLEISYIINDPVLTTFEYTFTQTNLCGYLETITVLNPTDFIIHNEADHDFTIQTDLRENADEYTILVKSTISVFDNHTLTSGTEHSAQASLKVTVDDPCAGTEFLEFIIPDLNVKVHDLSLEELVPDIKDTISEAAGDLSGLIFCGERTYELIDPQLHESYLTLNDDQVLSVISGDDAKIGIYEAQVKVSLVDYPEIFKLADFSIIINPCLVSDFVGTGGPENTEYGVAEPNISLGFMTISQDSCTYPVNYELVEPKSFIIVDQVTGEILVQSNNQEDEEVHIVQVMASIQMPTDYTNTEFETLKSYHSFELSVYVPCKLSEFDEPVLIEMMTSILGESQIQTFDEVQDSESRVRGDDTGLTFCGPRIYSIVGSPSYIQFDQETRDITLSTVDNSNIGQFQVELQIMLQDFPSVTKIVPFQVIVNPCEISEYTASIDSTAIEYLVNDPAVTTFAYIFTQTNLCGYPETITIDNTADFIIHNEADQDFTIYTDLRANVEVYTVSVSRSISVFDDHTLLTETEHSAQIQFEVTVIDPCGFTELGDFVIQDMLLKVHDLSLEQQMVDILDTVSQSAGNSDGLTFCGERIYELIDPSLHEAFMTFDQRVLTVLSDGNAEIGFYEAQVKVSLADYPEIFKMADFSITINPCEVINFEIATGPEDTDYAISAVEKRLDLPIISQGACTYPVVYELVVPQEFMTINETTGEIKIETHDREAEDIYQIQIKASILIPVDYSNTEFTTLESSHTFQLSMYVPMDLCQLTQLDQTILIDLTTSVLGISQKQNFVEVQDTESKASGDQSGLTFCGPRLYSIVGSPSYIQFNEESREITLSTSDEQDIGLFQVELLIKLQDFPDVTSKSLFQVIVNPCKITDYIENIDSTVISYTINDPAVKTFAYSFTQTNLCGYPETIVIDNSTDFIIHNELDQDFTIYSELRENANIYTVTVSSMITVFDDHTLTSQTDHFAEALLQVTVIDPCLSTQFTEFVIPDLLINVHGGSFTETVPDMQDSFSETVGILEDGTSFCGDKTYELIDPQLYESYLTFADLSLTIRSDDDSEIGVYEATIKVSLVDYPDIFTVADFAVVISPCEVQSFKITTGPEDTEYAISSEQKVLDLPNIEQGICKYPVKFELVTPQLFMTIDETTGEIKIETDAREAEDIYQIEIKATTTIPTDSSGTQLTTLESIHSFQLRLYVPLDLCILTVLQELVLTDMKTSIMGVSETQSFNEVQDSESQASGDQSGLTFCGPRLYSIVGSPSYIQFDEQTREIILSTQDQIDIGQFQVEILVQIQNFPDVTRKVSFQVTINPCEITDYILSIDLTQLSYTVNDPAITTFAYSFTQTNLCGYPETIVIENPAEFIIHNEVDQNFTIQTDLREDADIYTITISSMITVFDDHTLTSETEHNASSSLQVTVIDPCLQSQLLDFQIPDLFSYNQGEILTRELPIVQDSVSQDKAQDQNDKFFCGERVYEIVSADSDYLTIIDGLTFAFDTSMVTQHIDYNAEVHVTLKDYPQLGPVSTLVNLKVFTCRLDSIEQQEDISATYSIRTPEISVNFEKFKEEPDCGIPLTYEFTMEDGSQMPNWLTPDPESRSMTILSNDVEDEALYVILISGSTPTGYAYEPLSVTLRVTLDLKFNCSQDEITSLEQIQDLKMSLLELSANRWVELQFEQIRDSCTKSYQLQKKEGSSEFATWNDLSQSESSVISIDQDKDAIMLQFDARELDGQMWTLKLIVVNQAGNQSQESQFDVTFIDACWEVQLSPPVFQQSEYIFELYRDRLDIQFTPMEVEIDCGGIYIELIQVSEGNVILLDSNFESELIDRKWIGTHTFRLNSFNGIVNPQSPFGNQGLFYSVLSETVTVTVTDPCTTTEILASTVFPESFSVQAGRTSNQIELTGPTNSVSTQYGNGYNKCGPLAYQVLSASDQQPARSSHFSLTATTDLVNGDSVNLKVKSAAGNGPVITESLIIKVYLRQIEGAEPILIPIDIAYRECEVVEYLAPIIADQVFMYQSFDPLVIYFGFDQGLCTFKETIQAFKINQDNNSSIKELLPGFITLSPSEQSLTISKPGSFVTTLGDYTIELRGTLSNTISTISSSQFTVSVINTDLAAEKIKEEEAQFEVAQSLGSFELLLSDQIVTVGQSLTYPIDYVRINPDEEINKLPTISAEEAGKQPFVMQTSVGMQKIKSFATFDEQVNELIVEGDRLTDKDIGFYTISVQASFTNGTLTETVNGKFRLEVRPQPKVIRETEKEAGENTTPENVIEIEEWKGLIEYSEETDKEYSPDQPVPYVESLTETGVLTILWDRAMYKISNVTQVPPTEVLIRENQARRNLEYYWLSDDSSNQSYEYVEVKKAVELSLLKEDDEDKFLDWYVIDSNTELFRIQILFNPEDLISERPTIQHLQVVFWGTEFFRSQKTNVAVRLGTSIQWPIYNQIRQEQAEIVNEIKKDSRITLMTGLILMIPFCTLGTLLPTWMFINTMQLLVHLPLMNGQLPPAVHSILVELLSFAKLDWLAFSNKTQDSAALISEDQPLFDQIRLACGYTDTYVLYFTIALIVALFLSVIQLVIGYMMSRRYDKEIKSLSKKCGTFSNFAIRLFYILFLEACLSMCINIVTEKSSRLMQITSFGLIALFSFFVGFLFLVLCFKKGYGPQTTDLYKKYTILQSLNSLRPLKDEQALVQLVRNDPELYNFAMGYNQRAKKEQQLQKKNTTNPGKTPTPPLYLETQVTNRPLLTEERTIQKRTEQLENSQEDLFQMNHLLRTDDDYNIKHIPLAVKKVSDDILSQCISSEIKIPVPQANSGNNSQKPSQLEEPPRLSIDSNLNRMEFLQINMNSDDEETKKNIQKVASRSTFQPSSLDPATDSRNDERNNINMILMTDGDQPSSPGAAQTLYNPIQIGQGAKTSRHRALQQLTDESFKPTSGAGRITLTPQCEAPAITNQSTFQKQVTKEETEEFTHRFRHSVKTGMTCRTDEFLTDQCSVEVCNAPNVAAMSVESITLTQDNTPGADNKRQISLIYERVGIEVEEQEQLEGGEQEDSNHTKRDLQQPQEPQQPSATMYSSIRLEDQPQDQQSMQAIRLNDDSFSVSNCRPQQINSDRPRTKLNQRGVDLALNNLSFQKPVSDKRSESVIYDHGFGNFINEQYENLQVVGIQTTETEKEDSYSYDVKDKNDAIEEVIRATTIPMPFILTENDDEDEDNEEVNIILDSRLIARIKTKLESEIILSARYRTLFSGLKINHPRGVALIHPLAFLLRRIIFVCSFMYFLEQPVFSVLILMCVTLAMLAYGLHEKQWEAPAINRQNIFNEAILYTITALFFFCRGNLAQVEVHGIVGPVMLVLIGSLVLVNLIAMLYCFLRIALLCLKRIYGTQKEDIRISLKQSLRQDVQKIVISIADDEVFSKSMTRGDKSHKSWKSIKSVKSFINIQDCGFVEKVEAADGATTGSRLVKVSKSQTSLWKRIFYRKKQQSSTDVTKLAPSTPTSKLIQELWMKGDEDNEAGLIKLIGSSAGGFQGCFRQVEVPEEDGQQDKMLNGSKKRRMSQDNLMRIEIKDQNGYDPMGVFRDDVQSKDSYQPSLNNSNLYIKAGTTLNNIKTGADCISQQPSLKTDRECLNMSEAFEFQSQCQGENNAPHLQHSFITKGRGGALFLKGRGASIVSGFQPQNNQVSTSVIHNNPDVFDVPSDLRHHDSEIVDEFVSGCDALQRLNLHNVKQDYAHDDISPKVLDISGAEVPQLSAPGTPCKIKIENVIEKSNSVIVIPLDVIRSPATEMRKRRQHKPYLINDLNSITQRQSIEEGTPTVEKKGRDLTRTFQNIEDEIEKELQNVGFDNELQQRIENCQQIKLGPKEHLDTAEQDDIMVDLQVIEQSISKAGVNSNDELLTPWMSHKVSQIQNMGNSVIHEVDEQSLPSRSRTPASIFKKNESPNFNRQRSTRSPIQESPEASIVNVGQPNNMTQESPQRELEVVTQSPTLKIYRPDSQQNGIFNLSGSKVSNKEVNKLAATLQNCVGIAGEKKTPFSDSTNRKQKEMIGNDNKQSGYRVRNDLITAGVFSMPASPMKDVLSSHMIGQRTQSLKNGPQPLLSRNLINNPQTERNILSDLPSFNNKTIDSENLQIQVMQVPQYVSGVNSEVVSNANFISPRKYKISDNVPRNILSKNGTTLSIKNISVNNTFDQQKPQNSSVNQTQVSSPNRRASLEHNIGNASLDNGMAYLNQRDNNAFGNRNQSLISNDRNSKHVAHIVHRASPDRMSHDSRVPSEGSRFARTGASLMNIFKSQSLSPEKDVQNNKLLIQKPTGSFGGLINGSVESVNILQMSPRPKIQDRMDSLSRVNIHDGNIQVSHIAKAMAQANSASKALPRADKFVSPRVVMARKLNGGNSSGKQPSMRMQRLQSDIKSTYTPQAVNRSSIRSNYKSPRTSGFQQQPAIHHMNSQQERTMANGRPVVSPDYDLDLLSNELNSMQGSLPPALALRTSTSPRANRPNFNNAGVFVPR